MKKLLYLYKQTIYKNCGVDPQQQSDMPNWRNYVFATILIYFLLFSLLTVVPGVIISIEARIYLLAFIDAGAFLFLMFVALYPPLKPGTRKLLFLGFMYVLACSLLFFLGSFGPGLLYLLAITVLKTLIIRRTGYYTVIINTAICVLYGIGIHYRYINSPGHEYTIASWVAVSANLVVLSAVFSVLLPMLIRRVEDSNARYRAVLTTVEQQNEQLRKIAWLYSHKVRGPVATIRGLRGVMNILQPHDPDNQTVIEGIDTAAAQLDTIIKEIDRNARAADANAIENG